jgi:hypothetical protein
VQEKTSIGEAHRTACSALPGCDELGIDPQRTGGDPATWPRRLNVTFRD